MSALITGSMAYDTIMVFHDYFKNHILPDQVHILNVSFLVPDLRREFGGCAGNIAYNLKLLGKEPLPMATVGQDFGPYREWLELCGIDQRYLREVEGTYTAQAYITTDLDDNQITAFHPGAMSHAHLNQVPTDAGIEIGIVAPDGRDGMIQHAEQFHEAGIPFIFDPGQGTPMFEGDELLRFIELATWAIFNDYEAKLVQEKTRLTPELISDDVDAVVVTKGAEGSVVYIDRRPIRIPPARVEKVVDPTGCGDAYRAGVLFGLLENYDWETIGAIASLMGAIKVEHAGTQNHRFSLDQFRQRFYDNYGYHF
ncbi:adenosine kinase [Methylomarinovum caldicuralii]|uniref:Adenosine kinase n=1 Tax=Methylomarinovum caldicuralii TaxID=438856 RepID=A0AAU9C0W4_9GAMM|nr:carbohydrate kinase family protein [Methylomarinovum caldicuralii]BCX81962.1 adenosine kinase [Methylomarinovum caldicuralii]